MRDLEEEQKQAMLVSAREWASRWYDCVPKIEYGATSASIRHILLSVRRQVQTFWKGEAEYLPSRVIYRRMVEMDDLMIRRVFSALPKSERDTLIAEAKASVKKHGGTTEAHKARLLRKRFGIPTP